MREIWRRYSDLVIGFSLFLISGAAAAYAYAAVSEMERPRGFLVNNLMAGRSEYFAIAGKRCVGRLESLLDEREKIVQVVIGGTIKASYGTVKAEPKFRLEAYFNPLGQLSEGDLSLDNQDLEVRVGTAGVNPILVTYTSKWLDTPFSGTLSVPGPIMLKSDRTGSYHIESPHFAEAQRSYLPISAASIMKSLNLEIVPGGSPDLPASCKAGEVEFLDLSPVLDTIGPVFRGLGGISGVTGALEQHSQP